MKVVYIAHPISGDVDGNILKVIDIVRTINLNSENILPFAPYIVDLKALDDSNALQRERGIKNNSYWLATNVVDEVWVFGGISKGVSEEIMLANEKEIDCYYLVGATPLEIINFIKTGSGIPKIIIK
jgi:hypothetical protein